jgi:hypothetical protein
VNVSINIIVAIAGICLIDLCYIFEIHTQQDATQRNKKKRETNKQTCKRPVGEAHNVVTTAILYVNI